MLKSIICKNLNIIGRGLAGIVHVDKRVHCNFIVHPINHETLLAQHLLAVTGAEMKHW